MKFTLKRENIKLGQLLKACGLVESGAEAKIVINKGLVKVNNKIEKQRGKKIVSNDVVEFSGEIINII